MRVTQNTAPQALMSLNREWNICTETEANTGDCKDMNVNVNCAKRGIAKRHAKPTRFSRQVQDDESEAAYDIDISFPAARSVLEGQFF